MNAQVQYTPGEVYIRCYSDGTGLYESTILAVSKSAKSIRTNVGWVDAAEFHKTVRGKLGRYERRKFLWWTREVFVREA